jgi:hypothetical protein
LFFLGTPRQFPYERGNKPFKIGSLERVQLAEWWEAATSQAVAKRLAERRGTLRQGIYRAAVYFEASHSHISNTERLIDLAIAVESMFSPTDDRELRFRIAQNIANLIGSNPAERRVIFDSISDLYKRRSKLVHGSYDVEQYEKGKFVTSEEIDNWASYVRRSLVALLAIYLKNEPPPSRESLLKRLEQLTFDGDREALRQDIDIGALLP